MIIIQNNNNNHNNNKYPKLLKNLYKKKIKTTNFGT